jgi:predicted molibdopterin-dependent oxidoreductase YjgC
MFKPLTPLDTSAADAVTLQVDGVAVPARTGQTLAVALLNAGLVPFRTTAMSGSPRAPLCLMGSCFECVVQLDGSRNVQACMVLVRPGMQVQRQWGARDMGSRE